MQKQVCLVIAHQGFRDEEFHHPKQILEKAGVQVTVASSSIQTAQGKLGMTYNPDILLEDVRVDDFDALVFIGGPGSKEYFDNPTALSLSRQFYNQGKIIAAICIAPVILATSGILKGKNATVWESEAHTIQEKGAIYTEKDVEVDGNIITASGPFAAEKFGQALLDSLSRQ